MWSLRRLFLFLLLTFVSTQQEQVQVQDDDFYYIDLDSFSSNIVKPKDFSQEQQVVYTINTLDDLQSRFPEKLQDLGNIFFFKCTNSSMQYNPRTKLWTEIVKQDPQAQTITRKLDRWVAISSCLESIHGSGGYLSRYVIFYIHATVENQIGVASGLPPVFYYLTGGLNVSLGIKAGMSKLLTLLFSCAINPGEIAQFLIRPKYVLIPNMKTIMYKFKGKKLHKVRVEYIKSFKMLSIDTPEHQCWVSRNIADLQCSAQISEDVHIEL